MLPVTTPQNAEELIGRTAVDPAGETIGEIDQVYLDHDSDRPLWVTVATGVLGMRAKFAPAGGSRLDEAGQVILRAPGDLISAAPDVEDDTRMTAAEQESLFAHFAEFIEAPADERPDAS
jgi:hypothetical protein